LHVTPRTVRYWFSGQVSVPYAAFKLLRLLRWFELPPPFDGWCIHSGRLWDAEGRCVRPEDGAWWSLVCRQAQGFRTLYRRSYELDRALLAMTPDGRAALGLPPVPAGSDGPPADRLADRGRTGRDAPTAAGGRAAQPPGGLNLLLEHFPTEDHANGPLSLGNPPPRGAPESCERPLTKQPLSAGLAAPAPAPWGDGGYAPHGDPVPARLGAVRGDPARLPGQPAAP
jgi:hypothetical protein